MASTTVSAKNSTSKNKTRVRGEINRPATSPTLCPSFRRLTTSAPKSWTAPMKMQPKTTHNTAGNQPQKTAMAGPTMGPVPAMLVK